MENSEHPILEMRLERGEVYLEDGAYYGIALDGVHVHLGIEGTEDLIESYLQDYSPNKW